jgi:hypothetical protein
MEDGVDGAPRRKRELVRHGACTLDDLQRPELLEGELGAWAVDHHHLCVRL